MLKAERLETESKVFVMDTPVVGKIKKFPLTAALFAAVIVCVGTAPSPVPGSVPDDLRIRPDQAVLAPSLQLFSL